MIKLANKQTTELWNHLRQGFETLRNYDETLPPVKSVSKVSPRYKTSVMLSNTKFQVRLLKNTVETNLDTDLVHEIELQLDRELDRMFFTSISYPQKKGTPNGVSTEFYLSNITVYDWGHALVALVGNVATLKQVECLNLGIRSSGFGFDIIED